MVTVQLAVQKAEAIAELPWIKALQGVPLRIVEAAKGLPLGPQCMCIIWLTIDGKTCQVQTFI